MRIFSRLIKRKDDDLSECWMSYKYEYDANGSCQAIFRRMTKQEYERFINAQD